MNYSSILFLLFSLYFYDNVVSIALEATNLKTHKEAARRSNFEFLKLENLNISKTSIYRSLVRVKRLDQNDGAGKFAQAANMDQLKVLRLFLQNFKNLWAASYIGGSHPFHPNVPKAIVMLFKARIVEFFFPPVGDDAIKG